MNTKNIVIIGTGNVAWHIANSFAHHHYIRVVQVFNHHLSPKAKQFAKQFHLNLVTDYKKLDTTADVYLIAVKDEAIVDVALQLKPLKLKGIIAHTSGSVDITVLKEASTHIGVYYPLQTFYSGAEINWKETPILLEANQTKGLHLLRTIAKTVSNYVHTLKSAERLTLHLAAVFANNFTNALYAASYQIVENTLTKKQTKLLNPIIQQSVVKLQKHHPLEAQTGPAKRHDKVTLQKHMALIKHNPNLLKIYKTMTDLIVQQQAHKK